MWLAEKRCHHLWMGMVQFSPDLNYWHKQQVLYRLVLCCWQGHHVKSSTINKLAYCLQIQEPITVPLAGAQQKLKTAMKTNTKPILELL